jgi:glutamate carboxypeptidase
MQDAIVKLCNINSGTFNTAGLTKVKHAVLEEFSVLQGSSEAIDLAPYESIDSTGNIANHPIGQAVRIVKRPEADKRVFLCIHMDTVYDEHHPFQTCKLIEDKYINGPGVADAKGGIVVMLYALRCLEASPLAGRLGWEVILNPDEEIGSPSSTELFARSAQENRVGLLFEPAFADGAMVSQRRGTGNFAFVVTGRAAHSGREFEKGRNAIVEAAKIVCRINELNARDPAVTFNIGRIEGGGPLNMVPDKAIARVNVRVGDFSQIDWVREEFASIARDVYKNDGFGCHLHGDFLSPPKIMDERTTQVQRHVELCGEEIGLGIKWTHSGGSCDGNKLAVAGLPNIDTFGVVGGNIHSDQEYVDLESLVPRAKLVALLLLKYASGELAMP